MYPRLQLVRRVTKKARHRAGKKQCIIDLKEQICPGIFLALNGGYFVDYPSNIFATRVTKRYEQLTVYVTNSIPFTALLIFHCSTPWLYGQMNMFLVL